VKKRNLICIPVIILGLAAWPANSVRAQEAKSDSDAKKMNADAIYRSVYRLEFVVRELEAGKIVNSRSYTMSQKLGDWGKIRVGSRVPFMVSDKNVQYQDVGINIDCKAQFLEEGLLLSTNFESSSALQESETRIPDAKGSAGATYSRPYWDPIIRRVSFNGDAFVTLGKPTIVARLDDVATNRKYEIEVTATKVK
jgi:hypothetical protein